jgi:hypothetical protein
MNNCGCVQDETAKRFIKAEQNPRLIRADFEVTGSGYGLVINRDIPFTLAAYLNYDEDIDTFYLESESWSTITLRIDADLDYSTDPIASATFPVYDPGVLDPEYVPGAGMIPDIDKSERWQGIFPATELNKLAGEDWVYASLIGDDNTLIAAAAFEVLGG